MSIENDFMGALQGDQDAISRVAEYIRLTAKGPAEAQRAATERWRFMEAVKGFKSEYADVMSDPLASARVREIDTQLATQNPDMPYAERLKRAGDQVRVERDGDYDNDKERGDLEGLAIIKGEGHFNAAGEFVRGPALTRDEETGQITGRARVRGGVFGLDDNAGTPDNLYAVSDAHERENSNIIAEMARGRRGQVAEEGA